MPYLIGIALALAIAAMAWRIGVDRERGFYPTVLLVIASYYILFAAMGGDGRTLGVEAGLLLVFAGAAFVGLRFSRWAIVAALTLHGLLDFVHHGLVVNPGVPAWWPGFCMAYDLTAAAALAWRLRLGNRLGLDWAPPRSRR